MCFVAASRRCQNSSRQRKLRISSSSSGSLDSTTTPSSSNSVSASSSGDRREPCLADSAPKWRAFNAALAVGKVIHTSALNRSCQLKRRTGTSPRRNAAGSNFSSKHSGLASCTTKRMRTPLAFTTRRPHSSAIASSTSVSGQPTSGSSPPRSPVMRRRKPQANSARAAGSLPGLRRDQRSSRYGRSAGSRSRCSTSPGSTPGAGGSSGPRFRWVTPSGPSSRTVPVPRTR